MASAHLGTGAEGFQLVINTRTGPLADLAVRKAVRDGIDYGQLATQVFNGLYDTSVGFYPAFLPYARQNQNFDAAKANQELDAAGWVKGGDGVRVKDGKPLSFALLTYPQQSDSKTVAVAVQSQLRAIGFAVEVRQVDDITATVQSPAGWDAAVMGNGAIDWTQTDPVTPSSRISPRAATTTMAGSAIRRSSSWLLSPSGCRGGDRQS